MRRSVSKGAKNANTHFQLWHSNGYHENQRGILRRTHPMRGLSDTSRKRERKYVPDRPCLLPDRSALLKDTVHQAALESPHGSEAPPAVPCCREAETRATTYEDLHRHNNDAQKAARDAKEASRTPRQRKHPGCERTDEG